MDARNTLAQTMVQPASMPFSRPVQPRPPGYGQFTDQMIKPPGVQMNPGFWSVQPGQSIDELGNRTYEGQPTPREDYPGEALWRWLMGGRGG